jgi:hypothetical protein
MISKRIARFVVVFAVLGLLGSAVGFGQTRRHELSFSYGAVSMDQFADAFSDFLTIVITFGTFSKQDATYSGIPFLTYHYAPKSRFGFGVAVGGYQAKGNLEFLGDPVGDYKETNVIAALEIDYHWIMKGSFQLYSGGGIGLRFRKGTYHVEDSTDTLSQTLGTFHINLLGFRVGKRVGLFGEIGAGYKGLVNLGLNAQF